MQKQNNCQPESHSKVPVKNEAESPCLSAQNFWRSKQEDPGFKGSLSYIVKIYLKNESRKKKELCFQVKKKWTGILKINHNKEQWGGIGSKQKAGVLRAPYVLKTLTALICTSY